MILQSQHTRYNLSWVNYLKPQRINLNTEDIGVYKWLWSVYCK